MIEDMLFALEGFIVAIIIGTLCYLPLAEWGLEHPAEFGPVYMTMCAFFGYVYLMLRGAFNE